MAKIALYRKYRPQNFDELFGQEHIAKTLKNSVLNGNFSHAYIFSGPRGTGKTSTARILAKAINCQENIKGNPDNKCNSCTQINSEKSMDIIEIDAASHTQVDNIREIIVERANFSPTSLKYKVYIIDEAHMLSKSSFNALLKTLEEPPAHAIFILATTEPHKIISTILSRCQRFDFRRIKVVDLVERLAFIAKNENIELEDGVLEIISKASEGGFRDAISLLDQISSLKKGKITKNDIQSILGLTDNTLIEDYIFSLIHKDIKSCYSHLEKLSDNGGDPGIFYKNTVNLLRKTIEFVLIGENQVDYSQEFSKQIKETVKGTNPKTLVHILDILIKTESTYKTVDTLLVLEVAAVKICIDNTEIDEKQINKSNEKIEIHSKVQKIEEVISKTQPSIKNGQKNDEIKWQELLLEIKGKNNSIHAFLRVSEPNFEDGFFVLAFPYKFHKERIEDTKNRRIVEDAIKKVYGKEYKVKCKLKPATLIHKEIPKKDDLLEDALVIFGGEVIE